MNTKSYTDADLGYIMLSNHFAHPGRVLVVGGALVLPRHLQDLVLNDVLPSDTQAERFGFLLPQATYREVTRRAEQVRAIEESIGEHNPFAYGLRLHFCKSLDLFSRSTLPWIQQYETGGYCEATPITTYDQQSVSALRTTLHVIKVIRTPAAYSVLHLHSQGR
jgi:hypothetical protein